MTLRKEGFLWVSGHMEGYYTCKTGSEDNGGVGLGLGVGLREEGREGR